jgi:hypothetical protein
MIAGTGTGAGTHPNSETDSTILSIPTTRLARIRSWVVRNRIGIGNVKVMFCLKLARSIDQPLDGDAYDDDLPVPPPARTKIRRTSLSRVPNVGADTFLNGRPQTQQSDGLSGKYSTTVQHDD